MASWLDGWVWPMPVFQGMRPEVSSGFGQRSSGMHLGADIMYRLRQRTDKRLPETDGRWWVPTATIPVFAVGPGHVSRVRHTDRWMVTLDHHDVPGFGPLATFYVHMDAVMVSEGQAVRPGDVIGMVGSTGTDLNHLHHEWWLTRLGSGRDQWARDPAPWLAGCSYIEYNGPGSGGPLVAGGGGSVPGYPGKPGTSTAAMVAAMALGGVALAL